MDRVVLSCWLRRTFHLSISSVSHGLSFLYVDGIAGEVCVGAQSEAVLPLGTRRKSLARVTMPPEQDPKNPALIPHDLVTAQSKNDRLISVLDSLCLLYSAQEMASRSRVFLDISVGTEPIGRLTIELFTDKTPKTCENFRQLCTGEHKGLSYARSPLHRVIDEFMVQGGDITKGDGTGGESIYGEEFEDESLKWRDMDAAGLVCSANRGWDTNGSQYAHQRVLVLDL